MKKNRILWIASLSVTVILVPFIISYGSYMDMKVNNTFEQDFRHEISEVIRQQKTFNMNEATPFEWDRMFVFQPYVSRSEMEKAIGVKWTTRDSWFGYWLDRVAGAEPLLQDTDHKLVFVKGNEIVLDVTLSRSEADFTPVRDMVHRDQARFRIHRNVVMPEDHQE